jgi:hypothetical protein
MASNCTHPARPATNTTQHVGEVVGKRFHHEGAGNVNYNCEECFEPEHASMMSLSRADVKAGKRGCVASRGAVAAFSRLGRPGVFGYGDGAMSNDQPITIRDLYPQMSEAELAVAEANLKRYVALLARIHDRLRVEGASWPDPPSGFDSFGNES